MSFNEQDLYNIAEKLVRDTGFEIAFEGQVVDLLRAAQNKDIDSVKVILDGADEETKKDISEAAALAITKAQTAIEEDIIANGSAEEIEFLNDMQETQLKIIDSFKG